MPSNVDTLTDADYVDTEGLANRNAVIAAYFLFLGRPPESEDIIEAQLKRRPTLAQLRQSFAGSAEFKSANLSPMNKPLNWPAQVVETNVTPRQAAAMIDHVAGSWRQLGDVEPHWSVLTSDQYRPERIAEAEEDFFRTGEHSVELFLKAAQRCGIDLLTLNSCMELGCGVGRVTLSLAKGFQYVLAYDISEPHLVIAREMASRSKIENVEFIRLRSLDDIRNGPPFDCFYSIIVLQHNPPPIIKMLIEVIFERLAPGGVAYFQVPTYSLNYQFVVDHYLDNLKTEGRMEVHVIPQQELLEVVRKSGCRVLEMREDNATGSPRIISNSLLIQKDRQ
jgi:2-polyprenyl-3-methyl-5-hydroxy-6-metoxy-1,4-benzoquinol methylase